MSAEVVVSVAAVAIAVTSLIVSLYQARMTQRHHEDSFRPILQITSHGGEVAGLQLANVGLGPAIVFDSSVSVDGVHRGRFEQSVVQSIADEVEEIVGGHVSKWTFGLEEYVVERDYSTLLFGMRRSDDRQSEELFRFIDDRLKFTICYRSIHGKAWEVTHPPDGRSQYP